MNTVDVVPPELEHEQPRPGLGGAMQRLQVLPDVIEGAVADRVEPILDPSSRIASAI
jgi:hypothetical protein